MSCGGPLPGRVVMLVANGVDGDSRVQKAAWSMAAAGWDVVLLGRAPGPERLEYRLGGARVVLLPVGSAVSGYERGRGASLRSAWARRAAYARARAVVARWDAVDAPRSARLRLAAVARRRLAAHPALDALLVPLGAGRVAGRLRPALDGLRGVLDRYGGWRSLNPWFRDLELAFAPVVAELAPELIHAHDFHMVGIGARSAARLGVPGRPVRWLYDAHEYLAGIEVPGRWDLRGRLRRRMLLGVEREYIGRADAVVTVSEAIAERLHRDHGLTRRPAVVLNAPLVRTDGAAGAYGAPEAAVPEVRRAVGLPPDAPLLLYSGGLAARRGVATAVAALPALPGVHLVLVARRGDPDAGELRALAGRLGVADRLHLADYVSPDQVIPYIASATAGLVPILHRPNHELSLITKYLEYLHARLPILCSDVAEMAATTRALGVGEVFQAGDTGAFCRAARTLLADPECYRRPYRPDGAAGRALPGYGWAGQAEVLDALYAELTGRRPRPAAPPPAGPLLLTPWPDGPGDPGRPCTARAADGGVPTVQG
ncbi:glycosyltransferase family 4 protein [Peterkaempfera bronchialis]|uniref:D-inositol 3-phosphate glycosyltransferase n=1 Tax=Peterkaempfera bronchialis TaxID=2126346 RepID=A0A345T138_9ACTN|nr:glycosyltransferase family 4 protein [Peterkaempfera bronchialis]AXI79693.1 glycosyltransferase [Peterkaempfera bronchialis]